MKCPHGDHEVELKNESMSQIPYCRVCKKDLPEDFIKELNDKKDDSE